MSDQFDPGSEDGVFAAIVAENSELDASMAAIVSEAEDVLLFRWADGMFELSPESRLLRQVGDRIDTVMRCTTVVVQRLSENSDDIPEEVAEALADGAKTLDKCLEEKLTSAEYKSLMGAARAMAFAASGMTESMLEQLGDMSGFFNSALVILQACVADGARYEFLYEA